MDNYLFNNKIVVLIIGIIIGISIFYLINNQKVHKNCNSTEKFVSAKE